MQNSDKLLQHSQYLKKYQGGLVDWLAYTVPKNKRGEKLLGETRHEYQNVILGEITRIEKRINALQFEIDKAFRAENKEYYLSNMPNYKRVKEESIVSILGGL